MIVLINPNSCGAMTAGMQRSAQAHTDGIEVAGWTSHDGPPAVQGSADGEAALAPMLALVRKAAREGAGAIIIGCFDDTGLDEARALAPCPVIGIGQAAYHLAAVSGRRFSVVTTLPVSVPILQANIEACGLAHCCARVRASGVEVLALERDPAAAAERVLQEIRRAEREDSIDSVVLGCGGMAFLPKMVRARTGLRPIDGVSAAAMAATALLGSGAPIHQ